MAEMDQGIKRLLQSHPADILALALVASLAILLICVLHFDLGRNSRMLLAIKPPIFVS